MTRIQRFVVGIDVEKNLDIETCAQKDLSSEDIQRAICVMFALPFKDVVVKEMWRP